MQRTLLNGSLFALLATSASLLTPALRAQSTAEGFTSTTDTIANGASLATVTPAGLVTFDGQNLELTDAQGATTSLLSFQSPVFGSFITLAAQGDLVLFGESSNGSIWSVPLPGFPFLGAPTQIGSLTFNFSATTFGSGRSFVVSAKTGGFSDPLNDLYLVSTMPGTISQIARVPGASGSLAERGTDILYGTASSLFPAPPGATDILAFSRAAISVAAVTQSPLTINDATVVFSGLDSASSLAVDSDGDIYASDFVSDSILRIDSTTGTLSTFSDFPNSGGVQFVAGDSLRSTFDAFQPAGAGELLVVESSFLSGTSQLRTIVPSRPELDLPQMVAGAGNVDLGVDGAPSSSTGLLFLGGPPTTIEFVIDLGLGGPLFYDPFLPVTGFGVPVASDANGRIDLSLLNPGFFPSGSMSSIEVGAQAFVIDPVTGGFTSSAPSSFRIR